MEKDGFIYIMTNKNKTVLYIEVTNNLVRRVYEHKNHLIKNSFSDRYNLEYCIYYEEFVYFDLAINREKELKKWNRQKKEALINKKNPEWKELVNEKGFIRNNQEIPYAVWNDGSNDNGAIPRFARNDGQTLVKGEGEKEARHSERSEETPHSHDCRHSERSEESNEKLK